MYIKIIRDMKKFKVGQQLFVAKAVKVGVSNSSSSAKFDLNPGDVVCVTAINVKSITVAFNIKFENWTPAGSFNMQTIMLGRIALKDACNLINVLSSDMQERNLVRQIVNNFPKHFSK